MNSIKKSLIGSILIGLLLMLGANKSPEKSITQKDLAGVWELISYKYGTETSFSAVPSFVKYRKFISDDNFHWISYGENGDDVIGAGGGKFKVKDGKYIETIEFFHPVGTGLIGNATTFDFTLQNGTWAITGNIKSVKLDPETGRTKSIDTIKLEEVWQKVQ